MQAQKNTDPAIYIVAFIGLIALICGIGLLTGGPITISGNDALIAKVFPASAPMLHMQNCSITVGNDVSIVYARPQIVLWGAVSANAVGASSVRACGIGDVITPNGVYKNVHWLSAQGILYVW